MQLIHYKMYPEDVDKSVVEQELNCSITWVDLVYSTAIDAHNFIDNRDGNVAVKYKDRKYTPRMAEGLEHTIRSRETFAQKLRDEEGFSEKALAPMIAKTNALKEQLVIQKEKEAQNGEVTGIKWLVRTVEEVTNGIRNDA